MESRLRIRPVEESPDKPKFYQTDYGLLDDRLHLDRVKMQCEFFNLYIDNELFYQNKVFLLENKLKSSTELINTLYNHIKRLEDYIKNKN